MPTTPRIPAPVVFSDLDGTLLDARTYEWTPAAPALERIRELGALLVLVSSKTASEIGLWQARLGISGPFVSENGGALYVPAGSPAAPPEAERVDAFLRIAFGLPIDRLREALAELARTVGVPLRGFGAMGRSEIAERTGLEGEDLDAASVREHDEPFVPARPLTDEEVARLEASATALGVRIDRGGRFHHVTGAHDKGHAIRVFLEHHARALGPAPTIGLGDGPNDRALLAAVDRAVVVARPDGSHASVLLASSPHAFRTRAAGPAGFTEGIDWALRSLGL